jgi:Spy/CpxP family protein refolding chaperone
MMQQSKWYALLFLLGAFVAGAAVGVASDRTIEHNRPMARGPRSPLDRMARDLSLTPAQRAAFDTILENRQKQMRQLFAPIQPQMDSLMALGKVVRDSTHEQLRRVLTPEQRVKFDKMHEEAKKRGADARRRWDKDRGPGPGRGPGPDKR